jgi:hypothetical protein
MVARISKGNSESQFLLFPRTIEAITDIAETVLSLPIWLWNESSFAVTRLTFQIPLLRTVDHAVRHSQVGSGRMSPFQHHSNGEKNLSAVILPNYLGNERRAALRLHSATEHRVVTGH